MRNVFGKEFGAKLQVLALVETPTAFAVLILRLFLNFRNNHIRNTMNQTLEHRKLSIVESLAEVQDESIIRQIENLISPSVDFWDDLSEKEKNLITQGLQQLKQGKRMEYSAFLRNYFEVKRTPTQ